MKAILKCESPKSCESIINGKKTILLSKTRPKLETPFNGYIYCTKETSHHRHILWGDEYRKPSKDLLVRVPKSRDICFIEQPIINEEYSRNIMNGKVIGEFVCDRIITYGPVFIVRYNIGACLTAEEKCSCSKRKTLYGLHISELKIYDKPKELGEFLAVDDKCKIGYSACAKQYCNFYPCEKKRLTRPPQSWCYVEEQE